MGRRFDHDLSSDDSDHDEITDESGLFAAEHAPRPQAAPATAGVSTLSAPASGYDALRGPPRSVPSTLPQEVIDLFCQHFREPADDRRRMWADVVSEARGDHHQDVARSLGLLPEAAPWEGEVPSVPAGRVRAELRARARDAQEAGAQVCLLTNLAHSLLRRLHDVKIGGQPLLAGPAGVPVGQALGTMLRFLAGSHAFWRDTLRKAVLEHATGTVTAMSPFAWPDGFPPLQALDDNLQRLVKQHNKRTAAAAAAGASALVGPAHGSTKRPASSSSAPAGKRPEVGASRTGQTGFSRGGPKPTQPPATSQ